jgi:hypothetical protein
MQRKRRKAVCQLGCGKLAVASTDKSNTMQMCRPHLRAAGGVPSDQVQCSLS